MLYKINGDNHEKTKELPKNIEEKLDAQLADLKQMILDNYRDATAYKMELDILAKVASHPVV